MLNLTSKLQTIIIYSLVGVIVTLFSTLVWTKLALGSANSDVTEQRTKVLTVQLDLERALSAEKSCKTAVKKLLTNAKKKHKIIKTYKQNIKKGGTHEKINNVTDFINYANSLQ